jgi:hypothetical protein
MQSQRRISTHDEPVLLDVMIAPTQTFAQPTGAALCHRLNRERVEKRARDVWPPPFLQR